MFHAKYIPLTKPEQLAQEYLSLKQTTNSVMEITNIFMEIDLFYPEYDALEEVFMFRYLSMLKTEIRDFVSTQPYRTLTELRSSARMRETELETQRKEESSTSEWY